MKKEQTTLKESYNNFLDNLKSKYSPGIFEEEPVDIVTFFRDWLKQPIYEAKEEVLRSFLGPGVWNTDYNEYLLLWGKGSGKDFLISRLCCYIGYLLLCMKNPHKFFGVTEGTPIEFANVSINGEQAKEVFFKRFVNAIKRTVDPRTGKNWFSEHGMDLRDDQDIQKRKVIFSSEDKKNITAYSLDSERYTGEGKNLLVVVFDEVGAFRVKSAKQLYDNLKDTQKTRFPKHHKRILISYKYDDNDFMQIRWKESVEDDRTYKSGPKAVWEMNPRITRESLNEEYEKDPERSERVYECKGSSTKSGYIKYKDKIILNVNKNRKTPVFEDVIPLRNITGLIFEPWFKGGATEELYKLNQKESLTTEEALLKKRIELQHEDAVYVIHIDLAKGKDGGDCAGFAMGHPYLINPESEETEVGVYIDLMLQLKAESKEGEIIFEEIRKLIYKLKNELGFNIEKVTFDGFQSVDFIQILEANEIEAGTLSIDRDTEAYDTLKSQLYKDVLDYYNYPVLLRELKELKLENKKVIHPDISLERDAQEGDNRGSKDVSDAVAGVCKNCLEQDIGSQGEIYLP